MASMRNAIARVLGATPLLESLVIGIGADRSWKALAGDLAALDYGAAAPLTGRAVRPPSFGNATMSSRPRRSDATQSA